MSQVGLQANDPKGVCRGDAAPRSGIVIFGDSLSFNIAGAGTLIGLLGAPWQAFNRGIPGNTTAMMLTRINVDVFSVFSRNTVTVWGGINDILNDRTAAQIEADLQAIYTAAKLDGVKVVAMAITPWKDAYGLWTAGRQAITDAVNAWILGAAVNVDYRIDLYALLEDPGLDSLLAAYDSGDALHINAAGNVVIETAVHAAVSWAL